MMFPAVPIESLKVWFQWGEAEAFCQCVGAVWEMRQQVAWQRCKKKNMTGFQLAKRSRSIHI